MGRRALHLTAEARQDAAREHVRRYARSERGKSTRAARHAQAYTQRRASQREILGLDMPPDLLRYARPLLRASFAFEPVPELALGLWTAPYTWLLPSASMRPLLLPGGTIWASPQARLSIYHYSRLMDEGFARAELWASDNLDVEAVEAVLKVEIFARREAWIAARDSNVETADVDMHDVYLHWGARIIAMLGKELEVRRRG
ncbi:hypothetical protein K466DRAFT_437844, partial [Polyporus arcularius HHB13444]